MPTSNYMPHLEATGDSFEPMKYNLSPFEDLLEVKI